MRRNESSSSTDILFTDLTSYTKYMLLETVMSKEAKEYATTWKTRLFNPPQHLCFSSASSEASVSVCGCLSRYDSDTFQKAMLRRAKGTGFKEPVPRKQVPQTQETLSEDGDAPACCWNACWSAQFLHLPQGSEDLLWSSGSTGLVPVESPGWRWNIISVSLKTGDFLPGPHYF